VKRGQILILVLAAAAIGLMAIVAGDKNDTSRGAGPAAQKAPAGALAITFDYSPEKAPLLAPLIKAFNTSHTKVDGKDVFVQARSANSGDTEMGIAKGTNKLVAWSPASSLWGRLLNFKADQAYVPEDNPSLVRTPLVIAMWETHARALGWPRKRLGFGDILRLARSNAGWADFGHPEFGAFKLVHTNPDYSTSGLSSVAAEYYSATGKTKNLVAGDIAKARAKVKAIEQSIVHYGDSTPFIKDQMLKAGPGYASAAFMEETTLIQFNAQRKNLPKLVAIYPGEGTFYSDDPFIVLDAPWVTPEQKRAATAFRDFLLQRITPAAAAREGFRPGDPKVAPQAPLDAAHGVDPAQPTRVLDLPDSHVLDLIKRTWRADRKPANVLLVLDTSESMTQEEKLPRAKAGLTAFLNQVEPQDRVGLLEFNDVITPLVPIEPIRTNRQRLLEVARGLYATGATQLYGVTLQSVTRVAKLADSSRINAVVLLTDGVNTVKKPSYGEVVTALAAQGESTQKVRVFTIAYGSAAASGRKQLKGIAAASGGKYYEGDTSNIESVYRQISSFF
jgi:Ca-activated chloride channel family protein